MRFFPCGMTSKLGSKVQGFGAVEVVFLYKVTPGTQVDCSAACPITLLIRSASSRTDAASSALPSLPDFIGIYSRFDGPSKIIHPDRKYMNIDAMPDE